MFLHEFGEDFVLALQLLFQQGDPPVLVVAGAAGAVLECGSGVLEELLLPTVEHRGVNAVLVAQIRHRGVFEEMEPKYGDLLRGAEAIPSFLGHGKTSARDCSLFERLVLPIPTEAKQSNELAVEFGNGYWPPNLTRMIRFAEVFPNREVVVTLSLCLGWSHFVEIIYLKDPLQRDFYAEMCRIERWSVRTLRKKIGGMLFERTALSKKPEMLVQQELATLREGDTLTPDLVFRDPYFLDFLGLKDTYSEKDLQEAMLREMEQFILELGAGFTFVARQKRMVIDGEDFYLDLLFYHRKLRRLVAVELKLERFKAADKGQMELYLRWLEKHEMEPGEETPIGLILARTRATSRSSCSTWARAAFASRPT